MHKRFTITLIPFICTFFLTSCSGTPESALRPLISLQWFDTYEDAKSHMDAYKLIAERSSDSQRMQDYSDTELFDINCDLTLCFTDSGLIGLNYHDTAQNQRYREWYGTLESEYGLPTEEGSGMASWYDDPLGKNTAVYLFNLEEGVQVSFYATADSPDKSYQKTRNTYIPTPELRTPVVPVADETTTSTTAAATEFPEETAETAAETTISRFREGNTSFTEEYEENGDLSEETAISSENTTTETTTFTDTTQTSSVTATEPPKEDRSRKFLLDDLRFYGSPDSERAKMNSYKQLYEYRTEEAGAPWELIMEYENVPYLGKNCDGVLCFTSLGLVGVNYFDPNKSDYSYWVKELTDIYGRPDEKQYDYSKWNNDPVGKGTTVYVFALEDGVQISFFADDTGSELSGT